MRRIALSLTLLAACDEEPTPPVTPRQDQIGIIVHLDSLSDLQVALESCEAELVGQHHATVLVSSPAPDDSGARPMSLQADALVMPDYLDCLLKALAALHTDP